MGTDPSATDGFDPLFDLPQPPLPPGDNIVSTGLYRPDLSLATGDYLMHDFRSQRSLSDTTVRWFVDVFPAETGSEITITLDLSGFPNDLPVQVRRLMSGERWNRQANTMVCGFIPGSTAPQRLLIVAGDTTPPTIRFDEPSLDTAYIVSTLIRMRQSVSDASGIDSCSLEVLDLNRGITYPVLDTNDAPSEVVWQPPNRWLSDSALVKITLRDSMGNVSLSWSPPFKVVPDTARTQLSAGWHSFGVPLEPVGSHADSVRSFLENDSVYIFEYDRERGYRHVDSVGTGQGYFIGLLHQRGIAIWGIPTDGSFVAPLPTGFSMISNPTVFSIGLEDLTFVVDGNVHSYVSARALGIISNGCYGYDHMTGSYQLADSLLPWMGYWLPVLEPGVSIRYVAGGNSPLQRTMTARGNGWTATVRAECRGAIDTLFSFGVHPEASDGFDAVYDIAAPPIPPVPPTISVVAHHPDWKSVVGNRFLRVIHKKGSKTVWRFVVSAPADTPALVQWGGSTGSVPKGLRIRDASATGEWVAFDSTWSYAYEGGEQVFDIVSTRTNAEEHLQSPGSFGVTQNFPNPFNGRTSCIVDIPVRGRLTIRIYDLRGRLVDVVLDGMLDAGRQVVSWNADLSSGTYFGNVFYQPESGGEGETQRIWRMIMMK